MGKGTDTRMGALLQGLLATFTGGSLILFAVLAATIGLSTPQSDSPPIAERGGSRSGGSVRVQGLGSPGENGPSTGPTTAPTTPTPPPSTGGTVASTPGTASSPPAIAVGDSDNSPPDTGAAVASPEFGVSVPDILTPNDPGTAAGPPVGAAPFRPGSFFPTTPDELPDSFRALFGAGNGLGARDVDKADRVSRHIGRKAVRKATRTDSKAKTSGRAEKVRRPQHAGGVAASNNAHGKRSAPKHAKKADHNQRKDNKHEARDQNKESKRANKDAKRESKEAKKENHGRGTAGGDHDDDDNDDDDD